MTRQTSVRLRLSVRGSFFRVPPRRRLVRLASCLFLFGGSVASLPAQTTYTWNTAGGGNWDATNAVGWNTEGGYPNTAGDTAIFSQDLTANRTITINVADARVGNLILEDTVPSAHGWTLAGATSTQKLVFDVVSGTATVTSSGTNSISAAILLADNILFSLSGGVLNHSYNPGIDGAKSITVTNGFLNLGSQWVTHNFKPLVIRAGGKVRVRSGLADSCGVTVDAGGTYEYAATQDDWMSGINGAGAIVLVQAGLLMGSSSSFSGPISGAGGLRMSGNTLTLSGINTYSGATTLRGGSTKIILQNGNAIADTGAIIFGTSDGSATSTSVLQLDASETVGSVHSAYGTGMINLGNKTLTTGSNDASTVFAGRIYGTGGNLVKTGAGTFTLTGTNDYTGTTLVSGGTLLINGAVTNGGDLTVSSGGCVGGQGLFDPADSRSLTVGDGGVLRLGVGTNGTFAVGTVSSPNSLTLNGSLLAASDAARNPETPWLTVSGDLTIGTSASLSGFGLDVLDSGSTYVLVSYGGSCVGRFADRMISGTSWGVRYEDAQKRIVLAQIGRGLVVTIF